MHEQQSRFRTCPRSGLTSMSPLCSPSVVVASPPSSPNCLPRQIANLAYLMLILEVHTHKQQSRLPFLPQADFDSTRFVALSNPPPSPNSSYYHKPSFFINMKCLGHVQPRRERTRKRLWQRPHGGRQAAPGAFSSELGYQKTRESMISSGVLRQVLSRPRQQ